MSPPVSTRIPAFSPFFNPLTHRMARRRVTHTEKYRNGDIKLLSGHSWSATKIHVVRHIEGGRHSYYVQDSRGRIADVQVVKGGPTGKYLRTDPNSECSHDLHDLAVS